MVVVLPGVLLVTGDVKGDVMDVIVDGCGWMWLDCGY